MIEAVLFDLDGTLLPMDNEDFTNYYLQLLGKKFHELGYDPKRSIKGVWNGLKHMNSNDGTMTNEQAFWNGFQEVMHQVLNHPKDELNELLLEFYQNEFKKAKNATQPNDMAKQTIQKIKQLNLKVILATNPIFPKQAVLTRLQWIGLKEEDFDGITTYESAHFCKPNPAYYEEIMNRFELCAQNCIMIGNDVNEDIKPASSLHMKTYLVKDNQIGDDNEITDAGSFQDICSWLNQNIH